MNPPRRDRLPTGAAILGAWTVVAVVFSAQWAAMAAAHGEPFRWRLVFYNFSDSYTWALVTPAILRAARRSPLERTRWRRSLAFHVPVGVGVTLLQLLLVASVDRLVADPGGEGPATLAGTFVLYAARRFAFGLVTYWVIVGIAVARDYYRLYRDRELRASRLEARLAHAQLQVLRMQLQPHFLFNTLHAISALVHEDADEADRMVAHLSELLRLSLETAGAHEVTLRRELDVLAPYLRIEQARFGSRLGVRHEIAPDVLEARVPNLVLQPLVEDLVRRGVARRSGPGRIEIAARRSGDRLLLEVRDDGSGPHPATDAGREGPALANTRARLQQLYGSAQRLELRRTESGGLGVILEIPFERGNGGPGEGGGGSAATARERGPEAYGVEEDGWRSGRSAR